MVRLNLNANTPTDAGGSCFATTHWTVVVAAGQNSSLQSADALERLCRAYWYPLYSYVRRKGYRPEDAQDLTQAFFARLLERNLISRADRDKGRFRSFLLGTLKHFLANEWDRAAAMKRGGGATFTPWEDETMLDEGMHPMVPAGLTPDEAYKRQWALTLLEQVFARLRAECAAAGKEQLFDTLRSHISGENSAGSYVDVAARLQMTPGAAQVAVHRLRRRYGELLRAEIAHTVSCPAEIDAELRELFAVLHE